MRLFSGTRPNVITCHHSIEPDVTIAVLVLINVQGKLGVELICYCRWLLANIGVVAEGNILQENIGSEVNFIEELLSIWFGSAILIFVFITNHSLKCEGYSLIFVTVGVLHSKDISNGVHVWAESPV